MPLKRITALLAALPLAAAAHPHGDEPRAPAGWLPKGYIADTEPAWLRRLLAPPPAPGSALREAAETAQHLLLAEAVATESLDDGRLRLTTLRVLHDYHDRLGQDTAVMAEVTGALRRAPLHQGRPLLLLLDPTPDHSYLRTHADGSLVPAAGALSAFRLDAREQADTAASWLQAAPGDRRSATLEVLAGGHAELGRHALAELHTMSAEQLTEAEQQAIQQVMQRALPEKVGLADWLARQDAPPALITDADGEPPELRARLWQSRSTLGQRPTATLGRQWSSSEDEATRAAGAWLLALHGGEGSRHALQHLLGDERSAAVVRAATEALAFLPAPDARRLLPIAFDHAHASQRAAAARRILALPEDDASATLAALSISAGHEAARTHAAMLLVHRRGTDDALVRQLTHEAADREVRRVLRDGIVRRDVLHMHGEGHGHGLLPDPQQHGH